MSEAGMEWARGRIAQLEEDYTAACEAIRQLEANVAAYREQLTAAEAAREAVLAAAEAVAGEVRGEAAKAVCHYCRVGAPFVETPYGRNGRWHQNDVDPLVCSWCSASAIHAIPTPSAALQRVREQAQKEGAERALRVVWHAPALMKLDSQDEFVTRMIAALFPTPDAGGVQ